MSNSRTEEIIIFANDVRRHWGKNPIEIAKRLGIKVIFQQGVEPGASIIKINGYPTIISITGCSSQAGCQALCAHELGHALLHDDGINRFDGAYKTIVNDVEYEANLFAVALLFDDTQFNIPIRNMSNYLLKSVLDYNIEH